MKKQPLLQLRQGDVQLQQVAKLPDGCTEVPPEGNRIVLAHGEVTGHAHAIYDHQPVNAETDEQIAAKVEEMIKSGESSRRFLEYADAAIARAQSKARLLVAPNGERFFEIAAGRHQCAALNVSLIEQDEQAWTLRSQIGDVKFAKLAFTFDGERLVGPDFITLRHEEHTAHALPVGIYRLPKQMEYTPAELRRVAD